MTAAAFEMDRLPLRPGASSAGSRRKDRSCSRHRRCDARLGGAGAAAVLIAFYLGFASDVGAWATMFESRLGFARVYLVQTVGEAVNTLMPFGSLGGEPVKAMLLKRRYGISYREATATLLLAQAINTLAEVPFIPAWAWLSRARGGHRAAAGRDRHDRRRGLRRRLHGRAVRDAALLRARWSPSRRRRLAAGRTGASKLHQPALGLVRDVEQRLFTFVRHRPLRFCALRSCCRSC